MSIPAVNGYKEISTPKKIAAVAASAVVIGATVAAGLKGKEAGSGAKGFVKGIPAGYKAGFGAVVKGLTVAKDFVVKCAKKAAGAVVGLVKKIKPEQISE